MSACAGVYMRVWRGEGARVGRVNIILLRNVGKFSETEESLTKAILAAQLLL